MTNREYIGMKFAAFNLSEADYADVVASIDLNEEYRDTPEMGGAMITLLESCILAPRVKNVNENGFSITWDTDSVGKWYLWLCRRYGVKPNDDVLALLGMSAIIDISDQW